ncbi:hypothetical protein J6590_107722, partial [Homalodisca vitripennis]
MSGIAEQTVFLCIRKRGWNRKALFRRSHGFVKAWDFIQLKPGRGCTISRMAERQLPGLGNLALCYKKRPRAHLRRKQSSVLVPLESSQVNIL